MTFAAFHEHLLFVFLGFNAYVVAMMLFYRALDRASR